MIACNFQLKRRELPSNLHRIREEVRSFLAEQLATGAYRREPEGWDRYDIEFTKKVAAKGWIGMTWPRKFGGHERSALERYVVTEELLIAGAPVRAHWAADRQFGPQLLGIGTEEQRSYYLPRIAAGECYHAVGSSEPDAGSDIASIRTKATKTTGGWLINGRKVWTSYAHKATVIGVFARTSPRSEDNRRGGVTQFLVDLPNPNIQIRPIINLAGDHDFNEVVFDDVFVPDQQVLGTVDQAWIQVTGELAHERSGPERWLGSYGLVVSLIDGIRKPISKRDAEKIGGIVAQLWALHMMSFSISAMLERGNPVDAEAALTKDLGNAFDQEMPKIARDILPEGLRATLGDKGRFDEMLRRALFYGPSYTIRGGTKEMLRGTIARALGLR